MNDVPTLLDWTDNLLRGLRLTLLITVLATALMVIVSVVLGLLARSPRLVVRGPVRILIEFFRGTSLPIQLWWLFFALPLLGIKFDAILVGVLAFGLNYGAYGAEVVRGSVNAVPRAQWEAATALNLSPWQRMRRVVWPQAVALMIPSMNNLVIQLLKSTPLLYTISLVDLMTMGESFRFRGGDETVMYLALMAIYFVLAYAVTFASNMAETAATSRLGRHPGPRSLFRLRKPTTEEVAP